MLSAFTLGVSEFFWVLDRNCPRWRLPVCVSRDSYWSASSLYVALAVMLLGRGDSRLDPRLVFSSIDRRQDLRVRVVDNAAHGCLNGTWSPVLLRRYFRPLLSLCLDKLF